MNAIKQLLKVILLVFINILSNQTAQSQEQFRLLDYKNPDYRWQKLDLRFGLGGNNDFNKLEIDDGTSEKRKSSQFSNRLDANYYRTKNSTSYQGYQQVDFSGSLVSSRLDYENLTVENNDNQQKNRRGNVYLDAETVNRFYNNKKMFLEADLDFYGAIGGSTTEFSADQEIIPYEYKQSSDQYELSAGIPLLAGFGRIEEVQDARLAVYILDDLVASGDLKREATNEEILAFSEFITETKNQRFFDARLRKIAEITAIDSFLTVAGLKAESDASYYTLINDDWDFASGPVRSAGRRISAGLVPSASLGFIEVENFVRDTLNDSGSIANYSNLYQTTLYTRGIDFTTRYAWEKPSSLFWQHTFNADLAYSLYYQTLEMKSYNMDTLTSEAKINIDSPNIVLNLGYKVGYYPNSRTEISLAINTVYNQFWGKQETDEENEIDTGNVLVQNKIQLACYYYISPQLRFTLSLGSIYSFTRQNQEQPEDATGDEFQHDFHNSIGASLTYSIF